MKKVIYHGWIGKDEELGWFVEWKEDTSQIGCSFCATFNNRLNIDGRHQHKVETPATAVEFWDKKLGKPISLEPTPVGYRVYTFAEVKL